MSITLNAETHYTTAIAAYGTLIYNIQKHNCNKYWGHLATCKTHTHNNNMEQLATCRSHSHNNHPENLATWRKHNHGKHADQLASFRNTITLIMQTICHKAKT